MRKYLKEQAADRSPVQTYQCPRCRTVFSSLDAIRLLDPASQLFLCDNCGCACAGLGAGFGCSGTPGVLGCRRAGVSRFAVHALVVKSAAKAPMAWLCTSLHRANRSSATTAGVRAELAGKAARSSLDHCQNGFKCMMSSIGCRC